MTETPHIVGVVGNDIVFDTRIRKVAAAAAAAGFRSTILCYTPGDTPTTSELPGVEVIRVPVAFNAYLKNGRVPAPLRPLDGRELAGRHEGHRVYQLMRARRLSAAIADPASPSTMGQHLASIAARTSLRVRHDGFRARRKLHTTWDKSVAKLHRLRRRAGLRLFRPFRDGVPNIADYEVTLGPILEDLEPDLIHAHDYHMIGLAVTAARNLRARGRQTRVLYDAHELIEGLSYPKPTIRGWLRLEGAFIHDVDAVSGVSPEQVERIQERYRLATTPIVVMNAPVSIESAAVSPDIRTSLGIEGAILLYHGNVFEERGLSTMVEALPLLNDTVHVAILAPKDNQVVERALHLARRLGVEDRVHVSGYVSTERLLSYISTADVAVVPYLFTGNNDIALPNKLFESIQAGLPVLVSDMKSLSSFVRAHGVGEVFAAGSPADLAEKAKAMLDDIERYRAAITPEAKSIASWDSQAAELVRLYGSLLDVPVPSRLHITVDDITERKLSATLLRRPKLAIGPRNMAGQAFAIAGAVQEHLGVPALSYSVEKPEFGFGIHHQVSGEEWRDPKWQVLHRQTFAREFTHVIAESGTGMLGSMNGGFIDDQIDYLHDDGLQVAILLHGSEIRDPDRHSRLPFSPYAIDDEHIADLRQANARLRRHLDAIDAPIFVTTPDLIMDIEATWVPVVIRESQWTGLKPVFPKPRPTVLHLPTNGILKGSPHIDAAIRPLVEEGLVEYLRPRGHVASDEVRSLIEDADIVIDQIVIGAYGLMSCQGLAAGRLTIANIRDIGALRGDCPIVHADPESLQRVLVELIEERDTWQDRIRSGLDFVSRFHNGSYTAETLRPFLQVT